MLFKKAENKPPNICFLAQSGKRGDAQKRLFQHFKRLDESRGCPDCGQGIEERWTVGTVNSGKFPMPMREDYMK